MDADVIVVGAGLAGLRCATALVDAGREVIVVEAADAVGGRVRSEHVDGFTVDRGFQLLNPGYPAVRRWVDVDALDLHGFAAGVAARTSTGTLRLGDPLRAPGLLPQTLRATVTRPREVAALARWALPVARPHPGRRLLEALAGRPDVTRGAALDRVGAGGTLRRVVDAFLAGVVLEDDGSTADRFALLLVSSFLRGVPSLPARGMQALPDQLAAPLGDRVRLGRGATAVDATSVVTREGTLSARRVVVATGATATERLVGVPAPPAKGVVTCWWSAPDAPDTDLLHVDARSRPTGPLVNAAVISSAAPTYAPTGQHLVAGSALLGDRAPDEASMRRHASDLLGVGGGRWELVARHEVPEALPAQPAPFSDRRPVEVDGTFVCGDHRDTGSIQGALVSGQRAADAVLASWR